MPARVADYQATLSTERWGIKKTLMLVYPGKKMFLSKQFNITVSLLIPRFFANIRAIFLGQINEVVA